jgi:hypothetical protein
MCAGTTAIAAAARFTSYPSYVERAGASWPVVVVLGDTAVRHGWSGSVRLSW